MNGEARSRAASRPKQTLFYVPFAGTVCQIRSELLQLSTAVDFRYIAAVLSVLGQKLIYPMQ